MRCLGGLLDRCRSSSCPPRGCRSGRSGVLFPPPSSKFFFVCPLRGRPPRFSFLQPSPLFSLFTPGGPPTIVPYPFRRPATSQGRRNQKRCLVRPSAPSGRRLIGGGCSRLGSREALILPIGASRYVGKQPASFTLTTELPMSVGASGLPLLRREGSL